MYDMDEDAGEMEYKVLINEEEQYSLWPADDDIPQGWQAEGVKGPKSMCLDYIEKTWTDMRPKSLRKKMADARQVQQADSERRVSDKQESGSGQAEGNHDLVRFLCRGEHPLVAGVSSGTDVEAFKASVEKGFVYVTFTDTAGGTELGIKLDKRQLDTACADFKACTGIVRFVGDLALNWQSLRCFATIDIGTLKGVGYLKIATD